MKKEQLSFKNKDGEMLTGDFYSPEDRSISGCIIACHGFLSSRKTHWISAMADAAVKDGMALFAFDFSALGDSEGEILNMTVDKYIQDLKSCEDFIGKKFGKLVLAGNSLGGLVVLNSDLSSNKIKGIILLAPVSHFKTERYKRMSEAEIDDWKKNGYLEFKKKTGTAYNVPYTFYLNGMTFDSYDRYNNISKSTLIIHGTSDGSVDLKQSMELKSRIANSKLVVIEDMDHYFSNPEHMTQVVSKSVSFAKDVMK